ncbi:MAG TPA: peptidoglycan bridge formation glycyltransferase FemA/FemB family protein [Anaerolineales bacterium]
MRISNFQPSTWNSWVASLPGAHVLQTWEWGLVKERFSWQALPVVWLAGRDGIRMHISGEGLAESDHLAPGQVIAAVALVLQRTLPIRGLSTRLRVLYIPKGPLLDWNNAYLRGRVFVDLRHLARRQGAIFIKIDPDVPLGTGIPGQAEAQEDPLGEAVRTELAKHGWRFSDEQIQFRNTVQVDLSQSEDLLLANMKQKTRYNVRLAERKGVTIRPGTEADLGLLYRMYAETSVRDGFVIREEAYYRAVWSTFLQAGMAEPLIAEAGVDPGGAEALAAVITFRFAGKAWYLYGMSRLQHRDWMPNYLLQWEAMRRAKAAGCTVYDLWGAPERFDEADSLWGVYRFKEGLGGQVVRTLGAWDLPTNPLLYRLYTQTLPRLLDIMRRRGKAKTREIVS